MKSILLLILFSIANSVYAETVNDAIEAMNQGDGERAVAIFKKLSHEGNLDAKSYLGILYYKGQYVPQDVEKAVNIFEETAAKGNRIGQYNLAGLYLTGKGVEKDFSKAEVLLNKSAAQGYVKAETLLKAIRNQQSKTVSNNKEEILNLLAENTPKMLCGTKAYYSCLNMTSSSCLVTANPISNLCKRKFQKEWPDQFVSEEETQIYIKQYAYCVKEKHALANGSNVKKVDSCLSLKY